jgi:hypothetical protein
MPARKYVSKEEFLEKRKEYVREYKKNLTPEQREKYRVQAREAQKRVRQQSKMFEQLTKNS